MPSKYNKLYVALVTALAETVTLGLAEGNAAKWVAVVLSFAGAFGVFAVANAPGKVGD